jgi:hypothetical protein
MIHFLLRRGLAVGLVCAGLAGCRSDDRQAARPSKPEDPTAWTGSELSEAEPGSTKGRPKSSRLQGGWSSEANEVEKSLGVGR